MSIRAMLAVFARPRRMRYVASRPLAHTRRISAALTGALCVLVIVVIFVSVQFAAMGALRRNVHYSETPLSMQASDLLKPITDSGSGAASTTASAPPAQPVGPDFDEVGLQAVVDSWAATYKDKPSVQLIDPITGETLASYQKDKQYFTASIYKLYVAYLALQDIDSGVRDANQPFLNGNTRAQCIDLMIRNSDSPCAEKMLADIGKAQANARLLAMGITSTSLNRYMTTTADTAIMTAIIARGEGLSASSKDILQNAMLQQKYRDGIPAGLKGFTVGDKVGFYEVGWHDTAFVRLPSGTVLVLTIFTDKMSSRTITDLARRLQPLLSKY